MKADFSGLAKNRPSRKQQRIRAKNRRSPSTQPTPETRQRLGGTQAHNPSRIPCEESSISHDSAMVFIVFTNGEHVHPYQRGRAWLSGLRLNGWKGMKTERLVGVARCDLIGLCFGTASLRLRSGGCAESAEMASQHAGKICTTRDPRSMAPALKRSWPPLQRCPPLVACGGNDSCPMCKSHARVGLAHSVVYLPG